MNLRQFAVMVASSAVMVGQANATQINGTIDFSSIVGKNVKLIGANSFLTATGLDFPAGPNAQVDGALGAFAGEMGVTATFSDLTFGAAVTPLWVLTDGNFSFDLSPGAVVFRGAHFLTVDGVGVIHGAGFQDTPGTFTFTTQGSPSARRTTFSWSATDDATPAPDGGATALLLGAGLLGLGAFAVRKNAVTV